VTGEIGLFALILAFGVALFQGTVPLVGAARNNANLMAVSDVSSVVLCGLVTIAIVMLGHGYVTSDFSLLNVWQNSHTLKPLIYKISGVWGNHEGSLVLWVLILAIYGAALAVFGRQVPPALRARALAIQGLIAAGFLAFSIFTSNPFARLVPVPVEGMGLNPILQDPGLAFHPPCLYMGYVGLSVAFSFAIAGLLGKEVVVDHTGHRTEFKVDADLILTRIPTQAKADGFGRHAMRRVPPAGTVVKIVALFSFSTDQPRA